MPSEFFVRRIIFLAEGPVHKCHIENKTK